ncbi:MAG TPA: PhzF family phenazine biosynthesis protein [Acidimicrobiales bacterium]|nr:PhzF family phenazine biosynthesis protein [Acidimicrobiales bacterium]
MTGVVDPVSLDCTIADVFTDTPLTGNQLAVFADATGVDDALMQLLAREIGFSETTFVFPDDRVRIFTPGSELPFAGHPVLGTAFVLASLRGVREVTLLTGAGPVPVTFDDRGRGTMRQPLPTVSAWSGDTDALFAALGISGSRLPVEAYVNGPTHVYVVLPSTDEVAGLRPDTGRLTTVLPRSTISCVAGVGTSWKSRVFGPDLGVIEDPATGSAAGPLAVHLCRHGVVPWGTEITITQGVELQRPSTLYARATGSDAQLESVEVAGDTVIVGQSHFEL